MKIFSISLGCPKNRVDTETMLGALPAMGAPLEPVDDPRLADLVFINTCAFIQPAVRESARVILETADELAGAAPRPLLVVAGCLISRYGHRELASEIPEVDMWLSTREVDAWSAMIAARLGLAAADGDAARIDPAASRLASAAPSHAYLKLGEGCSNACSFCTIPTIRGPLHSREIESLAAEARRLVRRLGVKEIVCVAQDTTAFGKDRGRPELVDLLRRLLPIEGLRWLRLMYLYPAGLTDELLDWLRNAGPPLLPYFDIPLQHADPDILKAMGRPFAADPRKAVDRSRERFPDASMRTSLIVGFPGESEARFQRLLDFVAETRFDHVGVFEYYAEEGTYAASLPGQIPDEVKAERRELIMRTQAAISAARLAAWVDQELDILIDGPCEEWPGLYEGRAWFQAPEVDGKTYVSAPADLPGAGAIPAPGRLVSARVTDSSTYDLSALL